MRRVLLVLLLVSVSASVVMLPEISRAVIRPWCAKDVIKYYIWAGLDRTAYEEGWYDILNSRIIQSAANSWNAVRTIWPPYKQVAWGSFDVVVTVKDTIDGSGSTLGKTYWDGDVVKVVMDKYELTHNYYIDSGHGKATVAHELGHALGSYDLLNYNALMYRMDNYTSTHINTPQHYDTISLDNRYEAICHGGGSCLPTDPNCDDIMSINVVGG